jgi:hypothetical protein
MRPNIAFESGHADKQRAFSLCSWWRAAQRTLGGGRSETTVARIWISVVLVGLAACSAGMSKPAEPVPSEWRTYENKILGISLRHPRSMSVHTGEDAAFRGFIPWAPRPDLRLALPASSFEGTDISEAVVAIYAQLGKDCPPDWSEKPETQVVASRTFYHWNDGEGAGGHTVSADFFCTMFRDKPFAIAAMIQTYRIDEQTEDSVKRAAARHREIADLLLQVLKTLVLMDSIPSPK